MPKITTHAAALIVGVSILFAGAASAAEMKTFDNSSFEAAKSAGQPIVVDITATWCSTCAAQKPIIERLAADPAYEDMVVFHVDFDDQMEVVRSLGAQMQSTLRL